MARERKELFRKAVGLGGRWMNPRSDRSCRMGHVGFEGIHCERTFFLFILSCLFNNKQMSKFKVVISNLKFKKYNSGKFFRKLKLY